LASRWHAVLMAKGSRKDPARNEKQKKTLETRLAETSRLHVQATYAYIDDFILTRPAE
jgi:hypothetical protein